MRLRALSLMACLAGCGLGGCGGSGGGTATSGFARQVAVINAWSAALRRGDVSAAAGYFAHPSLFANGTPALAVRTRAQARAVNQALPCGARLLSAVRHGRYVDAAFELTGRPGPGGTSCASGAGQTAHTYFLIRHGLILAWIRAPDGAAPPGGGQTPVPVPTTSTPGLSV